MKQHFGEIIDSSLTQWKIHCWNWQEPAPFGSIVVAEHKKRSIVGLVANIQTGSSDPNRQPFAYQKTADELLQEQPQIFAFLQTVCTSLTVGYVQDGIFFHSLAPEPPCIHDFVRPATHHEEQQFFADVHFLHVITTAPLAVHNDELLLALLQHGWAQSLIDEVFLRDLLYTYALLANQDFKRFKLFLHRAQTITKQLRN